MSGSLADLSNIRQTPPLNGALAAAGVTILPDQDDDTPAPDKNGVIRIENADNTVTIQFGSSKKPASDKFDANLADEIGDGELNRICSQLLGEIDADAEARSDWIATRKAGIKMLGLEIESPKSGTDATAAPMEGMSTVRAPLLLEAVLRFQANARGELLPAAGPVKIALNTTDGDPTRDELASALEADFNTYLTQTAPEYYPDTDAMLFWVGFGGSGFKKLYHCPIRRRPVSESVDAADLIINPSATDLRNAERITHQIVMLDSMVKRMQIAEVYRETALPPYQDSEADDAKGAKSDIAGIHAGPNSMEKQRTILECYCHLTIDGLNVKDGKPSSAAEPDDLPVPYKVTMDKSSREVLEVRRNWVEGDKMYLAKTRFVRYPYVEAFGIYCIGLLQILGNTTKALTAALRLALDSAMFASFPGFLYSDAVSRQETMTFRIPPGSGQKIQTNGVPLRDMVESLPYKDATSGLMALMQQLDQQGRTLGGTAEMNIGEGVQNAPVGTTMALIDQATKVMDAVHKRLHAAQGEEFRLMKQLFVEDPMALIRHNDRPAREWDEAELTQALNDYDLQPVADPNVPTQTHRLMKAMALKQLQSQSPQLYDPKAVDEHILKMIGFSNPEALFAPPAPPGGPPPDLMAQAKMLDAQAKMASVQQAQQDTQVDQARNVAEDKQRADDRASAEKIEAQKAQTDMFKVQSENRRADLSHVAEMHNAQMDRMQDGANQHLDRAHDMANNAADRQVALVGHAVSAMPNEPAKTDKAPK